MDEERFRKDLAALKAHEKEVQQRMGIEERDQKSQEREKSSKAMRYTLLGAEFAAIFIGFVFGGHWLDQRWGTTPWLLLVGVAAGFGIALYRLITVARRLSE